jgi:hypothetical protein
MTQSDKSFLLRLNKINLQFNIDGIPIKKSTGDQFWPILCKLTDLHSSQPFPIGIFYGQTKPKDTEFLKYFVSDINSLSESGIVWDGYNIKIIIDCIICDAPARAFIAQIKGHMGRYGCGKCEQEGTHDRGMSFPETDAKMRTDEDFKNRKQEEHHIGNSVLELIIGFGMVSQLPFDYMHLLCLGIMRKLFYLWMQCSNRFRIPYRKAEEISNRLLLIKSYICREFARKPRSLKEIAKWKATEFIQVLVYTGPYIFHSILDKNVYMNFLVLHFAVRIILSPKTLGTEMLNYVQNLFELFVKEFSRLYGSKFVSYNVHNLIHICSDIKRFGNLNNFNAFPYENYLQTIKAFVHAAQKPLEQIKRRIIERRNCNTIRNTISEVVYPQFIETNYPKYNLNITQAPYYKKIAFKNFIVSCDESENCVILENGMIVKIEYMATVTECGVSTPVIVGKSFKNVESFYEYPQASNEVGICKTSELGSTTHWPVSLIRKKALCVPLGNSFFYVAELLHIF